MKKKQEPEVVMTDALSLTLRILAKIFNSVGLPGFSVIVLTAILFTFSSKDQKSEIIDTWFLFKTNNINCVLIIIFALVFLLIIQQVYYRGQIKLIKERIDDMAKEKSLLQSLLAERGLSSSNTP